MRPTGPFFAAPVGRVDHERRRVLLPNEANSRRRGLRPHAKPVTYRFFLGALAVWPRIAFAAADVLGAAAASAERAAAALVRRTPGWSPLGDSRPAASSAP